MMQARQLKPWDPVIKGRKDINSACDSFLFVDLRLSRGNFFHILKFYYLNQGIHQEELKIT